MFVICSLHINVCAFLYLVLFFLTIVGKERKRFVIIWYHANPRRETVCFIPSLPKYPKKATLCLLYSHNPSLSLVYGYKRERMSEYEFTPPTTHLFYFLVNQEKIVKSMATFVIHAHGKIRIIFFTRSKFVVCKDKM